MPETHTAASSESTQTNPKRNRVALSIIIIMAVASIALSISQVSLTKAAIGHVSAINNSGYKLLESIYEIDGETYNGEPYYFSEITQENSEAIIWGTNNNKAEPVELSRVSLPEGIIVAGKKNREEIEGITSWMLCVSTNEKNSSMRFDGKAHFLYYAYASKGSSQTKEEGLSESLGTGFALPDTWKISSGDVEWCNVSPSASPIIPSP